MNSTIDDWADDKNKTDLQIEEQDRKFKLIKLHFRTQFRQAFKYMGFYLLFSFGKYLACFYTLQQRDDKCEVNPLFIWLTVVGMYEFLNSIRYLTILYSLQMNSKDIFLLVLKEMLYKDLNISVTFDGIQEINRRGQIKRMVKLNLAQLNIPDATSNLEPPFSLWEIIHQAEVLNKYTEVMRVYNQFVFYLIFCCGNLAYISSDGNDCDENLNNITFLLLLVGYLFSAFLIVGFGLAVLSMSLYLPVILFLFIFKSVGNILNRVQTNSKFKKMKQVSYIEGDSDVTQCNICMLDYQIGDAIYQLPCSHKHNFHQGCLKQWLIIKQQCPVCRKYI